jgi:hypothetical protein
MNPALHSELSLFSHLLPSEHVGLAVAEIAPSGINQWAKLGQQPTYRIPPSWSQQIQQAMESVKEGALQPKAQPSVPAGRRQIEMDWISSNAKELGKYRGQWIVVEGERVLAHDKDYQPARDQAVKAGINRPLIFFVPDDDLPFMGV